MDELIKEVFEYSQIQIQKSVSEDCGRGTHIYLCASFHLLHAIIFDYVIFLPYKFFIAMCNQLQVYKYDVHHNF